VAALVLLDLSAAFDTVDHDILLQRLWVTYGISDTAHAWLRSYLSCRSQYVRCGSSRSSTIYLVCGVPQGSVLGSALFVLYTAGLSSLIESHGLSPNLYADDTQVYGFCRPAAVGVLSASISEGTAAVASWMRCNRLQLNADKTEVLWCTTGRRQHPLPSGTLMTDGTAVSASSSVRDLGIHIDADLVMRTHVQKTVSRCFAVLRHAAASNSSLSATACAFQSLVVTLVNSRLDYGNVALIGLPPILCVVCSHSLTQSRG